MNHVSSADIHIEINERPMSPFQIGVIGLCVMINMLDGFDVMVMPFAAASVSEEWQLSQVFLGLLKVNQLGMNLMFCVNYSIDHRRTVVGLTP